MTPAPLLSDFSRRYTPADLLAHLIEVPAANVVPLPRLRPVSGTGSSDGERPGDAFNARHSGAELLASLGFHSPRTKANNETDWVRPGKTAREGYSATDYGDHVTIYSETCRQQWPGLEVRRPYDAFALFTIARHGGDFSAAAAELSTQGYGEPRHPEDLSWLPAPSTTTTPETPWGQGDEISTPQSEDRRHGWEFVDLGKIVAAGYATPRPTILTRTDGAALFYPGRINGMFGEPGCGKSMLAFMAAAQEIAAGHSVLYVDLEDHAASVIERVHGFGVSHEAIVERFLYVSPEMPWSDGARASFADVVAARDVTLMVLDSTGEAMALDGAKPNDDDDTARWFQRLPRAIAKLGPSVLLLDHVPKSSLGQPTEIGSQRKRAAIDGAAYFIEARVKPARGVTGYLKLTCAKDRNGNFQAGTVIADAVVESNDAGTEIAISLTKHEKVTRPTVLMGRVSRYLSTLGEPASSNSIEKNVEGKSGAIRLALTCLVDEGFATRDERGRGRGIYFAHAKPFVEPVEGPEWAPTSSPRPHLVPTSSPPPGTKAKVPRPPRPLAT